MSTFLELVQDLARESGTLSAAQLTSVTGQTGRAEKMVGWVRKAWTRIQNSRAEWLWMRAEFSDSLIEGTSRYTGTSFNLTRWGRWIGDSPSTGYRPFTIYDPDIGVSDEGAIRQITYERWHAQYDRGEQDNNRPVDWAISPSGEFCVGPIPDAAYVISGAYMKSPQTLSANGDIPEMPERFHDLITWQAHRLLLIHDGAFNELTWANLEMTQLFSELLREQLPPITAKAMRPLA